MWISKVSNYEMEALVPEVGTHSLRRDIFKHILKSIIDKHQHTHFFTFTLSIIELKNAR